MYASLKQILSSSLLGPIYSLKKRYIPLLLLYFGYGFQSITAVTIIFWEKENLTLSASELLSLSVWVTLPWTLKMIVGQCVDAVPILGSRRKAYVILGAILLTLGYIALMGLMMKAPWVMWMGESYLVYLVASLLVAFGFMIQDVTADTMTTEVVDREGKSDATIKKELAFVQILGRLSFMLAGVIAALFTGKLAEWFHSNPHNIMWVALIIPIISLIGVAFIQLDKNQGVQPKIDKPILGGGLSYALFLLVMAFLPLGTEMVSSGVFVPVLEWITDYSQEITFMVSFGLLSSLLWWMLKKESAQTTKDILLVLGALFIFRAMPSTGPGFTWWAIDILGFDQSFFGIIRFVSSIVPFVLLWLVADFIAGKPVKTVLLFLIFAGGLLSLPELSLFYGIHEMIGVSPRLVILADTFVESPLVHISMIPMLSIIAFYAPIHARATWFALAASFMNLATTAGVLGTKYLNEIFVISRKVVGSDGEILVAQDYSQLGILMVVKIIIVFVVPFVGVMILLPKKQV